MRAQVAALPGVPPGEVALARNATEVPRTLIPGYRRLRAGEAVLYADLDCDSAQGYKDGLAARQGARVVRIAPRGPVAVAARPVGRASARARRALLDRFGIFTVHRAGVAKGACVRVTPAVFTSPVQIAALVQALEVLVPEMKRT